MVRHIMAVRQHPSAHKTTAHPPTLHFGPKPSGTYVQADGFCHDLSLAPRNTKVLAPGCIEVDMDMRYAALGGVPVRRAWGGIVLRGTELGCFPVGVA